MPFSRKWSWFLTTVWMSQLETMTVSLRRFPKWIYLPVKPLEKLWDLKGKTKQQIKKQMNKSKKYPPIIKFETQLLKRATEKGCSHSQRVEWCNQPTNLWCCILHATNSFFPCLLFSMSKLFSGHQPLQLGGVKKTLPYHNSQRHFKGFVGCIRNVIVDSKVGPPRPGLGLLLIIVGTCCDGFLWSFPGLWFRAPCRVPEQCSWLCPYGWNVSEWWDGLLWHPWQVCWWLGFLPLWLFPRICWISMWKRYCKF